MYDCYCDYEPSTIWNETLPKAKIQHKCYECAGPILPGERYERIESLYDGLWQTYKTCQRCMNIVAYVKAHVPCFCRLHGGLYEDGGAVDTCRDYEREAPGLMFGLGRLIVVKNRFKESHRPPNKE